MTQLEPSRRIGADFPLSLLATTKLVGAVGIEPTTFAPFPRFTERLARNCCLLGHCLAKTSYTLRMNDLAKSWIRTVPIRFLP